MRQRITTKPKTTTIVISPKPRNNINYINITRHYISLFGRVSDGPLPCPVPSLRIIGYEQPGHQGTLFFFVYIRHTCIGPIVDR